MTRRTSWTTFIVVGILATCAGGCGGDAPKSDATPAAQPARQGGYENGLSAEKRSRFYHLSEGGEIYPVDWLLALETSGTDASGNTPSRPFVETLERFGFLPDPVSQENPYGLPVGMTVAKSPVTGLDNVGLNCATCHVGELT